MKTIYTIFALLLLLNISYSQEKEESFKITTDNENFKIENKNIYANCASKFIIEVQLIDTVFKVIETDTSTQQANCMCYFDLETEIKNVRNGNYKIEIFRQYLDKYGYGKDTIFLVYSEEITLNIALIMPPYYFIFKQSDCLSEVDVDYKQRIPPSIEVYPNPFSNKLIIMNNGFLNESYNYCIYSLYGSLVNKNDFILGVNEQYEINTDSYVPGLYLLILSNSNNKYPYQKRYLLIKE